MTLKDLRDLAITMAVSLSIVGACGLISPAVIAARVERTIEECERAPSAQALDECLQSIESYIESQNSLSEETDARIRALRIAHGVTRSL